MVPMWVAAPALGAGGAGYFSRAVFFVSMVAQVLGQGLVRTVTPVFARLAETPERLAGALRDALTAASGLLAVCLGTVAGAGPAALVLLLGPGWDEAASLVVWCVPGLVLQMLYMVGHRADRARGAPAAETVQRTVLAVSVAGTAVAWLAADARVLALVSAVAAGAGHGSQLLGWRRLPGFGSVGGVYAVHAAVGVGVAAAARLGCWAGAGLLGPRTPLASLAPLLPFAPADAARSGLVPLLTGLLAALLATVCLLPVRRWIPALRLASAHGLLTGTALLPRPSRLPHARRRRSTAR
jgi:hypothetical protein